LINSTSWLALTPCDAQSITKQRKIPRVAMRRRSVVARKLYAAIISLEFIAIEKPHPHTITEICSADRPAGLRCLS